MAASCVRDRVHTTASCIGDMIMLHVGHIGPDDPGWLCNLPEQLSEHAWTWYSEVPTTALCGGNHNRNYINYTVWPIA